eukprot:8173137-Pyramimonas_sp.AAC.1
MMHPAGKEPPTRPRRRPRPSRTSSTEPPGASGRPPVSEVEGLRRRAPRAPPPRSSDFGSAVV